jgi:dephospho-CoA kinase
MLVLGLTGNIASGKSTVAARLVKHGAVLIDADRLAREAVVPGSPALAEIAARWGPAVLAADGSLDRGAMRRLVFANEEDRLALNAIIHPRVEALRQEQVAAARAAGAEIVVCDIPLLFESGREHGFAGVIVVDAPDALRLHRLVTTRALTSDEASRMMRAQLSSEEKRARADFIIENSGSIDSLHAQVDALWEQLIARARHSP